MKIPLNQIVNSFLKIYLMKKEANIEGNIEEKLWEWPPRHPGLDNKMF